MSADVFDVVQQVSEEFPLVVIQTFQLLLHEDGYLVVELGLAGSWRAVEGLSRSSHG